MEQKLSELLKYNADGLVTVVTQDATNGQVLMVAHMNREAVDRTIETGRATYWSRSRQELWVKGETSGHVQWVNEMYVDCDADALLLRVDQVGPACHAGYRSCFFRALNEAGELSTIALPFEQEERQREAEREW
jgi:phosphoribosyl-AMP cyclohydrolase